MALTKTEPVALAGAIAALPPAVEAFLAAFGLWDPTPAQLASMNGLYLAVLGILVAFARGRVTPMVLGGVDLDQLAIAAYEDVDGVDETDGEDLHALDAVHGGE